MDNLKSSQLVIFSHSTIFITFSYRSLAGFLFKLLRSSRRRKPEVALDFCVWPLCAVLRFPVPLDKGNEGSGDEIGQEREGSGVVNGADVLCVDSDWNADSTGRLEDFVNYTTYLDF